ncbi:protein ORF34 [Lake sturgeon herpesvirus]|nr:protein ORF34 [Lake sturgeon herpesvirus]
MSSVYIVENTAITGQLEEVYSAPDTHVYQGVFNLPKNYHGLICHIDKVKVSAHVADCKIGKGYYYITKPNSRGCLGVPSVTLANPLTVPVDRVKVPLYYPFSDIDQNYKDQEMVTLDMAHGLLNTELTSTVLGKYRAVINGLRYAESSCRTHVNDAWQWYANMLTQNQSKPKTVTCNCYVCAKHPVSGYVGVMHANSNDEKLFVFNVFHPTHVTSKTKLIDFRLNVPGDDAAIPDLLCSMYPLIFDPIKNMVHKLTDVNSLHSTFGYNGTLSSLENNFPCIVKVGNQYAFVQNKKALQTLFEFLFMLEENYNQVCVTDEDSQFTLTVVLPVDYKTPKSTPSLSFVLTCNVNVYTGVNTATEAESLLVGINPDITTHNNGQIYCTPLLSTKMFLYKFDKFQTIDIDSLRV